MLEKLEEYLVNIYMNQSPNIDFNIFSKISDQIYTLGGFMKDSQDAYLLYRKNNKFGFKLNDDQYFVLYRRGKFIKSKDFQEMCMRDPECDKRNYEEEFKDVDWVSVAESDNTTGQIKKISFLVNKSAYLVTDYCESYLKDKRNLVAVFDRSLFNMENLKKLGISESGKDDFDISTKREKDVMVIVPTKMHKGYSIKDTSIDIKDEIFRNGITTMINNEAVMVDRKSRFIIQDLDECANNLEQMINQKTGYDER